MSFPAQNGERRLGDRLREKEARMMERAVPVAPIAPLAPAVLPTVADPAVSTAPRRIGDRLRAMEQVPEQSADQMVRGEVARARAAVPAETEVPAVLRTVYAGDARLYEAAEARAAGLGDYGTGREAIAAVPGGTPAYRADVARYNETQDAAAAGERLRAMLQAGEIDPDTATRAALRIPGLSERMPRLYASAEARAAANPALREGALPPALASLVASADPATYDARQLAAARERGGIAGEVAAAGQAFGRGALQVVPSVGRAVGAAADAVGLDGVAGYFRDGADRRQARVDEILPMAPGFEDSLPVQAAGAIGSTVPYAAAAIASGGIVAPAALGAASTAGDDYAAAVRDGATGGQTAMRTAAGAVIGALQGVPVGRGAGRVLESLAAREGSGLVGFVRRLQAEAGEEGVQEFFDGLSRDVAARYTGDPDREIDFNSYFEQAVLGAIAGGAVAGGTEGTARGTARRAGAFETRQAAREAEARARSDFELETLPTTPDAPTPRPVDAVDPLQAAAGAGVLDPTAAPTAPGPEPVASDPAGSAVVEGAPAAPQLAPDASPDASPFPTDVRFNEREGTFSIRAGTATNELTGEGEAGRLTGAIREGALRVQNVGVNATERGNGYGVQMYEAAAGEAAARGLALESDVEVTEDAARVWEALGRRGYGVEQNPAAVLDGGKWTAGGAPVYRVADPTRPAEGVATDVPEAAEPVTQGAVTMPADRVPERDRAGRFAPAAEVAQGDGQAGAVPEVAPGAPSEASPDVVQGTQADVQRLRERAGLADVEAEEGRRWNRVLDEGRDLVESGGVEAVTQRLLEPSPGDARRPLSDTEQAALTLAQTRLAREYDGAMREADALKAQGNEDAAALARTRAAAVRDNLDRVSEANYRAGTAAGQSLAARRLAIASETEDLATVLRHARTMKGAALTPWETEAMTARVQALQDENGKLRAAVVHAEAVARVEADARIRAEAEAQSAQRAKRTRRADTNAARIERAQRERGRLVDRLGDLGIEVQRRINSGLGLTVAQSAVVAKIVRTYIAEGAATLAEATALLQQDVPNATEEDVVQALTTGTPSALTAEQQRIIRTRANRLRAVVGEARRAVETAGGRTAREKGELRERALLVARSGSYNLTEIGERVRKAMPGASDAEIVAALSDPARAPNLARAQREVDRARVATSRAAKAIRASQQRLLPKTTGQKVSNVVGAVRAGILGGDAGSFMRQGGFLLGSHPVAAFRGLIKGVQAAVNEAGAEVYDLNLREMPEQYYRDLAGLKLRPVGSDAAASTAVDGREETYVSQWYEAPLWKRMAGAGAIGYITGTGGPTAINRALRGTGGAVAGAAAKPVLEAGERFFAVQMNTLNSLVFDAYAADWRERGGADVDELKLVATALNVAGGIGTLRAQGGVRTAFDVALLSAKFTISRFETPARMYAVARKSTAGRRFVARAVGGYAGSAVLLGTALWMAGFTINLGDPDDPEWGTASSPTGHHIDLFPGGFRSTFRLQLRLMKGALRISGALPRQADEPGAPSSGFMVKRPSDLFFDYLENRVAPGISVADEMESGYDFNSEKTSRAESLRRATTPLVIQSAQEGNEAGGPVSGAGAGFLDFIGLGDNVYRPGR